MTSRRGFIGSLGMVLAGLLTEWSPRFGGCGIKEKWTIRPSSPAVIAGYVWHGGCDGDFNNPKNWTYDRVPVPGRYAKIVVVGGNMMSQTMPKYPIDELVIMRGSVGVG